MSLLFVVATTTASTATAASTTIKNALNETELKQALQKPLITGASISANYGTISPSRRLALRHTTQDQIVTYAFGGRPGKDTAENLPKDFLKDRTSVLAMDLFFWDSALPEARTSIKALQRLMEQVKAKKIPIVLGEIPDLLPGHQPQREKLNSAIRQACETYDKCFLMPFIELHSKVLRERSLTINNRKYSFRELVPDGLHLSDTAGEYLADIMKDLMLGKKIK